MAIQDKFDDMVTAAVQRWAETHPRPDKPMLFRMGGGAYTPRELAREISDRTEFGQKQLQIIRHFAERKDIGIDGVLRMLEGPASATHSEHPAR